MCDHFEEWARVNKLHRSFDEQGRLESTAYDGACTRRVISRENRVEAGADFGRFYFQELAHDTCERLSGPTWIDADVTAWNHLMWSNPRR